MSTESKEPFLKMRGTQSQILDSFIEAILKNGGIEDEYYQKPIASHKEELKTEDKGGEPE